MMNYKLIVMKTLSTLLSWLNLDVNKIFFKNFGAGYMDGMHLHCKCKMLDFDRILQSLIL